MTTVIKVENISKQYRLGAINIRTLRDDAQRWWHKLRGKEDPLSKVSIISQAAPGTAHDKDDDKILWALRGVSFEVSKGEVLGVIGRNGAGKSTLLKILSRVTGPTDGRIKIRGRIASLLEVGTGFHPELTGRENVFLNGAILGMTQKEVSSKFDAIVEFAEIERFIDTPVKRYSSGMYVRLAFAVAAHLDPEVLVVDEVLAVGDASFQKKCIGKMGEVAHEGRTVLFVSHNMAAINSLCTRVLLLQKGMVHFDGAVSEGVRTYLSLRQHIGAMTEWSLESAPGSERVKITAVRLRAVHQTESQQDLFMSDALSIEVEYENLIEGQALYAGFQLFTSTDIPVMSSLNWPSSSDVVDVMAGKPLSKGRYKTTGVLPSYFLNEGSYYINAVILDDRSTMVAMAPESAMVNVVDDGLTRREYSGRWMGVVRIKIPWNTQYLR